MPPSPPTISTTIVQPYNGIRVNISNPENVSRNDVYRRVGFDEWEFLGSSLGQSGNFIDYAASSSVTYTYRVTAVAGDGTTADSNTTDSSVSYSGWWLKDLDNIEDTIELFVDGDSLDIEDHEDQAKFNPFGRKYPLVIKDATLKAAEFPVNVQFLGNDNYTTFKDLRKRQKVLLLQSPMEGEQWYFVFGSSVRTRILNTQDDYRLVTFTLVEVGRPSVSNQ